MKIDDKMGGLVVVGVQGDIVGVAIEVEKEASI